MVDWSLDKARELRQFAFSGAAAAGFALLQLIIVPVVLSGQPYWLSVATNANILSVGALGLWLTFSIGRIDIAQGAFAAIGGYTTAILSSRYGLSFWLCMPLSAAASAMAAALIGLPICDCAASIFRWSHSPSPRSRACSCSTAGR